MQHQKQIIEALGNKREEGQLPNQPIENLGNCPTIGFQQGEPIKHPKGILENVIVTVKGCKFPVDFVVLEMDFNGQFYDTPIILGRSFLHTTKMNIDFPTGIAKISCGDQSVEIKIFEENNSFPIIIAADLGDEQEEELLDHVLEKCIEKKLVLSWEKSHFMIKKGVVLGHIVMQVITENIFKIFSKFLNLLISLHYHELIISK
ncbi:unnamed protein product [Spirodela intermedia]|uniref:Reverse transcriptase domain-containing protein n=1 Tax=Spirodela intermedia TaxID=51605 RepID=A0A7I8JJG9_SPIIN|nr:unnamed protein product [Spirodela intermedia]CAA6670021.1 unnamed protein product [Spirodela intermedia]